MPEPSECLRCRGRMERGFVIDRGHVNALDSQKWVEGAPEKSFWKGLHTKDRDVFVTQTWRCERCGWLESYANPE